MIVRTNSESDRCIDLKPVIIRDPLGKRDIGEDWPISVQDQQTLE